MADRKTLSENELQQATGGTGDYGDLIPVPVDGFFYNMRVAIYLKGTVPTFVTNGTVFNYDAWSGDIEGDNGVNYCIHEDSAYFAVEIQ